MKLLHRWSGSYPFGVEGSLSYSEYPRVALFASDGSNTGAGFEITYGGEVDTETTTPEGPETQTLGKHALFHALLNSIQESVQMVANNSINLTLFYRMWWNNQDQ